MCVCVRRARLYCMMTSGWMLKSRSSLSLRTSSNSAASCCSAPCRSALPLSGRPFSLTMTSPSLRPPLWRAQGSEVSPAPPEAREGEWVRRTYPPVTAARLRARKSRR